MEKPMDGQAPGAPVGEEMEVQRWFELTGEEWCNQWRSDEIKNTILV
jgi:hypothetical protein